MKILKRDPFGYPIVIKGTLVRLLGAITHARYWRYNTLNIEGSEIIRHLPEKKVLFISNHQTYFADVAAMLHVFYASLSGRKDSLKNLSYLKKLKLNIYYVAASETMKKGILPKILAYTGSISIDRTWRNNGKAVNRPVRFSDITNISKALNDGWVITFPQGTTKPYQPVRRGTAHIIKTYEPIVVPIVIDGFRRAFDKKGIRKIRKGVNLSIRIKEPMEIDYKNDSIEDIVNQIQKSIEQQNPKKLNVSSKLT